MQKQLLNYQDKLYWIYRSISETQIKLENVSNIKDFWMCDLVLKDKNSGNDRLLFLREIPDTVILE